jgi:hypothetical protein
MSGTVDLVFGGKPYSAVQLPVLKARAWREQLIRSARELSESLFRQTNGHDEHFFAGLATVYLGFPDKLREMIFAYGEELPQEEITAAATDEDLITAFAAIMRVAFPYLHNLSLMVTFDLASKLEEGSLENLQAAVNLSSEVSTAEGPRFVSNEEFFSAPIGKGLSTPNAKRFKRVQVVDPVPSQAQG